MRLFLVFSFVFIGCGYEGSAPPAGEAPTAGATGEVSTAGTLGPSAPVRPDGAGAALRASLDADFSPDRTPGYDAARDALYAYEARVRGGQLCEVYGGACAALAPGDPSKAALAIGVNAEHTWPQSFGARDEPLKSDLHHLFAARDVVNSSRGNLPLADVPDASAEAWYRGTESLSRLPRGGRPGEWSQRGRGRFEPRDPHKGNAARALFYVAAVYPEVLGRPDGAAFFEAMRESLLAWNRLDPPDAAERARSAWIARLQGTENPFVTDPTLADRAFGSAVRPAGRPSVGETAPGAASPPTPGAPASDLWLAALHYDNAGNDVDEGVAMAGPPGATLDGWTLVLYNGTDGSVYRTVALSGPLPAGRRWVPVDGLQNGAPDGVALVAPTGTVAEFWSYEGPLVATGGPAAGRPAREMPVEEDGRGSPALALVRTSAAAPWRAGAHPATR